MRMKKTLFALLALTTALCLTSCGGDSPAAGSSSAESSAAETTGAAEETAPAETTAAAETTAEPAAPLNTNVVHAELENKLLNLKASFDIANLDGFETTEKDVVNDQFRSYSGYVYPDPEYYAPAMTIQYDLSVMSGQHVKDLESGGDQLYEKADFGSSYDTYLAKEVTNSGDKYRYTIIFVGGDYLDGAYMMKVQIMPQLDSATQEDVDLLADTFAKSLRMEGDDSVLKTADSFSLAEHGITVANQATIAGQEAEMKPSVFASSVISAQTEFTADGIGYSFHTYSFDDMSKFGVMGGGEYKDVTFAGKPGKIKVFGGIGSLDVYADIQISEDTIIHAAMSTDSALRQGELADAAKLGEKLKDMMSDENKAATTDLLAGYVNDIFSAFTFAE